MNTFVALRNRNFAFLWIGQLISEVGDLVLKIALPFYVFQLTGSLLQTGLTFIIETLPVILFGSLAGVLADRWDRRKIMIVVDVLRACILLTLLLVHSVEMIWLVYIVAGVQSFLALFFEPAYDALLPSLVPDEEQLTAANSLSALGNSITSLMGPLIGGALFGIFNLAGVVILDAVSFFFSALMIVLIASVKVQDASEEEEEEESVAFTWRHMLKQWVDGLRVVKGNSVVGTLISTFGILLLAQGILSVVLVAFVKEMLHGDATVYGLLVTMQGIGTLAGSLVAVYVCKLMKPVYLFAGTLSAAGLLLLLWVIFPTLILGLCLLPLIGFFVVIFSIAATTTLQTSVTDEYRGRVFGAFSTVNALTMLIGLVIASVFGDYLGVSLCLGAAAVLIMANGPIFLFMLTGEKKTEQMSEENLLPSPTPTDIAHTTEAMPKTPDDFVVEKEKVIARQSNSDELITSEE